MRFSALHYEWGYKALKAGKHVLMEKPTTNNADDTTELFAYAKEKNLVLLEANHIV
jgi:predicted dehydrogenase